MTSIKIERIVSFTSEDTVHIAENVLSKDTSKKWKCKTPGEKSAAIVLQLDHPCIINGIDIGNENSAYVEVLVSRSSSPEDFKVLLVMSTFMTPLEARQSQNINKVRMFKHDDLQSPEKDDKWDRIKVVCTQPFNRHVQYGLSFINFYSSDETSSKPKMTIGKFVVRPESPDIFSAGSLFAMKKAMEDSTVDTKLTAAAAVRKATAQAHEGSPIVKQKLKHNLTPRTDSPSKTSETSSRASRNRNELLYNKDEEESNDKINKIMDKKDKEKKQLRSKQEQQSLGKEKKATDKPKTNEKERRAMQQAKDHPKERHRKRKQEHDEPQQNIKKPKKEVLKKPFSKLLEDVVLVISGIQNPDRASLRSMAISMGARYKTDWGSSCTHLICAFTNTPKFMQVKGKGKIVTKKWIDDCYNEKKRLPWRRYALDKADKGPESEEEIWDEDIITHTAHTSQSKQDSDTDNDVETREEGSDTEERLAQLIKKQSEASASVFEADTDEEGSAKEKINADLTIHDELNNFYQDRFFYVDEDAFDNDMTKKIKRYVVAYKGILVENLEANIDIIVTNRGNSTVLKDLNSDAICLLPDWIWDCHNSQDVVAMTDYILE